MLCSSSYLDSYSFPLCPSEYLPFFFHPAMPILGKGKFAQSCLTLCAPMGCSLPGSSVHGIFQAIVLEWIAISFFRGSS